MWLTFEEDKIRHFFLFVKLFLVLLSMVLFHNDFYLRMWQMVTRSVSELLTDSVVKQIKDDKWDACKITEIKPT